MSKKRFKQYLMLLTVVGLVAVAAGGSGTFASFSAEVTNPGNTFASGTLFLHNTANGGTTCTSESNSTNVNPGTGVGGDSCDLLFNNIDLTGGDATATLALNNNGTVNATDLKWDVPSCSVTNNSATTGSGVTFGAAPACSDMWMTIQETDNTFAVPATDVACAAGTTTTPPDCDAPDGTYSLASNTPTNLLTAGGGAAPFNAGVTRYYVITIHPNVTNDNTLQNRLITFAMHWKLEQ